MRFKISQRLKATGLMVWVVVDTRNGSVVSEGTWTSCSNACRELNNDIPSPTITQKMIDGDGTHRNKFFAMLSQVRAMVFPSTQIVK